MKQYRVHRKADGVQIYVYAADDPVAWSGMGFDTHDHVEVLPEQPGQHVIYGGRRSVSRLEFLSLLTPAERITIRAAAAQSSEIDDYLKLLDAADSVSLDSESTVAGLSALEAAGLLSAGRAQEILNG